MTARIRAGLLLPAAALTAAACGSTTFTNAGTSSGGTAGAGTGGAAGSASGGSAGAGAVAGTGGSGGCQSIADCPAGKYCHAGKCLGCSDTTTFDFGTPEPLQKVNGATSGDQRFPRPGQNGVELFFRAGADKQATQLWYATDFNNVAPGAMGATVNTSGAAASGPLAVASLADLGPYDFFFDRTPNGAGTPRSLYAGTRTGKNLGNVIALPPPFNAVVSTGGAASDYSIAIAPQAKRAWWMSIRNGPTELITTAIGGTDQPTPVQIVMSPSGCHRTGNDATPWAARDGSFLLFRGPEVDANCAAAGPNDLYVAPLDGEGKPTGNATPISAVDQPGRDETDPSMSSDLCWLFFANNGGGDYNVYRAPRK